MPRVTTGLRDTRLLRDAAAIAAYRLWGKALNCEVCR